MKKLIQCLSHHKNFSLTKENIQAIKQVGFDGVFLQWYHNNPNIITQEINYCKNMSLDIEFIHLNYENTNHLWQNTNLTHDTIDTYLHKLYICNLNKINMIVMHLSSKEKAPQLSLSGIKNFQKIIKTAEQLNIKVALENTKISGRFEYLSNHIKSDYLGLCFDTGHYHCFYKDNINWSTLKNKIFTIHLHDNNLLKDEHLPVFDGNINWKNLINNLNKVNYKGNIVLEIHQENNIKENTLNFHKNCFNLAIKTHKLFKTSTY